MMRLPNFISFLVFCFAVASVRAGNDSVGDQIRSIFSTLGVEQTMDVLSTSFVQSIHDAQRYNDGQFHRDWEKMSHEPGLSNAFYFARNATFPSLVKMIQICGLQVSNFHVQMMKFLKNKCDSYMGKDAPFHPWNILRQDKESVAFVLFVCAISFTVLFIQFYTLHNLIIIVATSFLMYSLGGPHLCFRCLLSLVAVCWYIFDMVMLYPFRFAIGIVVYFVLSFLLSRFSSNQVEFDVSGLEIPELDTLNNRVHGVERKTDMIQTKIDRLTSLVEEMKDDLQ